ncbi:hypothetical protein BGZ75_008568 [Mortierella antarctica]|nr:hypothetical protein BGZ75_008568 [Mortierella antarctica]
MSPTHRNYCCGCIPLRFAVAIFSILALALGAASLWNVLRVGVLTGLFSVFFKKYALAKNFSVLWWTVTILVILLSGTNMVLLATREKDEIKGICQTDLLSENDKYLGGVGLYDPATLAVDVENCYRFVLVMAGVAMAVQVLVMMVGGWVASRYTSEIKHRKDGLAFTYGQGYGPLTGNQAGQTQPLVAHPYTQPSGSKGEWQ